MIKSIVLLGISLFFSLSLLAQYQIGLVPRQSPDRGTYEKIGNTAINIRYGSPSVKGRTVWGEMVPYESVWRAGANNATTIELSDKLWIEGQELEQGTYAFFVLPHEHQKWEVIFSKKAEQWGAFRYEEADDALRVSVLPRTCAFEERLTYQLSAQGARYGHLTLRWADKEIVLELETNYLQQFIALVEERVKTATDPDIRWVTYLQGAEHLLEIDAELETAQHWLEQSEILSQQITEWNPQYYPQAYIQGHLLWTKAQLLARQGKPKEAAILGKRVQTLGEKTLFYSRKKESEQIDEWIKQWEQ